MPLQKLNTPSVKFPAELTADWNTWRKGLNTLLRETEIDKTEATQLTNLLLIGSGVPTKRWGSEDYYLSGATGLGRGLLAAKDTDDTIDVLSITDWGILVKKSGASYTTITGASWASGYNMEMTQLGGNVYLANGNREMVRYDFSTLTGFPTLATPTGLTATNLSNASGLSTYSWRVSAISKVGETLASTPVSLASLPQNLNTTVVRVNWTAVSAASGDLSGYNIYRGSPGDEIWVGGVDNATTRFDDLGDLAPDPFRVVPDSDTTGGPIAKYIIRFQDRLVMAGISGAPSKVLISGRYPFHERFDWLSGGGFVLIEPDAGDDITGIATYYQSQSATQTIVVFKENSIWEVRLTQITLGSFVILDPVYRLLTASRGCSSHRSIVPVENDLMFVNRRGMYVLQYQPQLLNVINANELSAKIRPFFESLNNDDFEQVAAAYIDKKYVASFPSSKKSIVFDRERLAFVGPWTNSFGVNKWAPYLDEDGVERWIAMDSSDRFVTAFAKTLVDDKGTAFRTIFKSRKENFGDWTIFKTITEIFTLFRNVIGSLNLNVYLEERTGQILTAKAFSITGQTGTSGLGTDLFGLTMFGVSTNDAQLSTEELPKKTLLYKSGRTFQIEITTTGRTDNYELLGVRANAIPQPKSSPQDWVV